MEKYVRLDEARSIGSPRDSRYAVLAVFPFSSFFT